MANQVEIANSALTKVGAPHIMSLGDDTAPARIIKNRIANSIRYVLRRHPWNSSSKRAELAALVDTPLYQYSFQYQLPSDYVRLIRFYPEDIDFVIQGDKILSNEGIIRMTYVYDPKTETGNFDDMLAEAIASYLAWDISYSIVKSLSFKQQLEKEWKEALAKAKSADGQLAMPEALGADTWIDARVSNTLAEDRFNRYDAI